MNIFKQKILYKDFIYEWLMEKKQYVKESTYANYSNKVFNHIVPSLGNYLLQDLNHKIIQEFVLSLYKTGHKKKKGGLSEKTIRDIVIIIKDSLRKGMIEKLIPDIDLSFTYPKNHSKKRIVILTKQEQVRLTNYIVKHLTTRNIGILISLYSGVRIGELCALTWNDINFKKGILFINKTIQRIYIKDKKKNSSKVIISPPKTKNSNREIPLHRGFLELLKKVKSDDNHYILTGTEHHTEPRSYRKFFCATLKVAKIRNINFHSLRHTFATNCIALGTDYKTVSELLGHASVSITLNLYVHPSLSQKKKCINMICKVFEEKVVS